MNLLHPIAEIMTPNPITVSPDDQLIKIDHLFKENKFHHVPVVDEGKLVGIVSKSDFLFFKRGFNESQTMEKMEEVRMRNYTARDIMTKGIAKLSSKDRINVALEIFKVNIFHAIPVVDEGTLVGIVTPLDIIKKLAEDKGAINEYPK
jgi:acetoin utilization protein AcuB